MRSIFAFLLVSLTGCAALVIKFPSREHIEENSQLPPFFDVARPMPELIMGEPNSDKVNSQGFISRTFSFTSWKQSGYSKNDIIKGFFYAPIRQTAKDFFVILPASGEDTSAELIAENLAQLGFYTARIHSGFNPMPEDIINLASEMPSATMAVGVAAKFFQGAMQQRTIDLMRFLDRMEKDLHPSAFHAVGISLGGMTASLFTAIDPRVKSLMTVVSSASIARILMDSEASGIRKPRDILLEKYHLSYTEAYSLLEKNLRVVEPITYAPRIDPKRILMVSGMLDMLGIVDTAIPLSATHETWKAFVHPEWVTLLFTGHVSSFLAFLPFWIELPSIHHTLYTILLSEPFVDHLLNKHFIPKTIQ